MSTVHTEPSTELQNAMREVEEAQAYFDRAEGDEQIDEAHLRLMAAEATANRIVRDMKRERGLRVHDYKCSFQSDTLPSERI